MEQTMVKDARKLRLDSQLSVFVSREVHAVSLPRQRPAPLKGQRFLETFKIQDHVTTELRHTSKGEYARTFQELYKHSQLCGISNGDYLEGQ